MIRRHSLARCCCLLPSPPSRLRLYINSFRFSRSLPFSFLTLEQAEYNAASGHLCSFLQRPVLRRVFPRGLPCVLASSAPDEADCQGSHSEDFAAPISHGYFCVNTIASYSQKTYHALYYLHRFFCRSLLSSSSTRSLILALDNYLMRAFDKMFKRSFNTREGRIVKSKVTKTTYPEHVKRKLQDSVDDSPVAR